MTFASTLFRDQLVRASPLSRLAIFVCLSMLGVALNWPAASKLDRLLLGVLTERLPRPSIPDWSRIVGIVVPGGSTARTSEALRLAREHTHLIVVLTGPGDNEVAQALNTEGVEPERIIVEPRARNTYENAVQSRAIIGPSRDESWLLVTSAYHMPRALGSFYRAEFFVIPWAVDDTPNGSKDISHVVRHEWLGILSYWLLGRTVTFFPGGSLWERAAAPAPADRRQVQRDRLLQTSVLR